ncbi:motility associated factor glycosyltransferase family protein [Pseudoalteromonas luteoviolacea]|uniref:motility associated factor glycosyltransferase family protein n=1 Tax=Pseudoalteromonas luteoviolacea TaxID=43657 RepID=UPI001B38B0C1|nr:6-hydroxymethylpterin diphosphokinase MptE-like protein [Pseudoalteromonas luteoviolacea]MBQ4810846.1 motility associated factor glycosyltransferase family protein [Pseudoalteromonas luteoviolacea]
MEFINHNYGLLKQHLSHDFYRQLLCQNTNDTQVFQNNFYGSDAKKSCEEQVSLFLKHPTHLRLNYVSDNATKNAHQKCINALNLVAKELGCNPNSKPQRGTLIVLGLGAGYHIHKLLSLIHYTDVIVVESDIEQYATACANIDLNSIERECKKRHGSLTFFNPTSYEQLIDQLRAYVIKRGAHTLVDISLYRHYSTPLFDQVYTEFKQWRNNLASMWGFFEDELLGLTHSIENSKLCAVSSHENVFDSHSNIPVAVIGNGPSLDKNLKKLRQDSANMIIASCGTALGVLLKEGIIPDFHIEMERTPANYYLKERQLTDPRLKDVVLITLSTVFPKLINQFQHKIVFTKGNDLGSELFSNGLTAIKPLFHCNPTVTNMAAAALSRIGFNKLVLLGCDYGYVDPSAHHSQLSDYFNSASDLSQAKFDAELKVKGNFREYVYSSRIFNEARLAQEKLIKLTPTLDVSNTSDGALIIGAKPLDYDNIAIEASEKHKVMHDVFTYTQTAERARTSDIDLLGEAILFIKALKNTVQSALSIVDILNELNLAVQALYTSHNQINKLLLSGTIKYVAATIASHINHLPTNLWPQYVSKTRDYIDTMLAEVLQKLSPIVT